MQHMDARLCARVAVVVATNVAGTMQPLASVVIRNIASPSFSFFNDTVFYLIRKLVPLK